MAFAWPFELIECVSVCSNSAGPPPSPINVKAVVNPAKAPISEQSIELTWEQPTDQATSAGPVSEFYIELKPADSTRWQDVSADFTITEPHCTLPSKGMKEFTSYEFRVTAQNKAGKSKPSAPSNPVELGESVLPRARVHVRVRVHQCAWWAV